MKAAGQEAGDRGPGQRVTGERGTPRRVAHRLTRIIHERVVPVLGAPFYNQQRRHSSLGFLSPLAFERQWHQQYRAA